MARVCQFVYVLLTTQVLVALCFDIPFTEPSKCSSSQYFRFSSLECLDCGTGKKQSTDRLSCVCNDGFKIVEKHGGPELKCESCRALNKTTSLDGWSCISCPSNAVLDITSGQCLDCASGSVAVDRQPDGTLLSQRACVRCLMDTAPSYNSGNCKRCHSTFLRSNVSGLLCDCPKATHSITGGVCVSKSNLVLEVSNDIFTVTYDNGKAIVSYFFKEHFQSTQALCKLYQNFTACQLLGNLCVLLDYTLELEKSTSETDACREYLEISKNRNYRSRNFDWPVNMPWLYYKNENSGDATDILNKKDITVKFKANSQITFTLSTFTLNGTFVGLQNGLSHLQLCQDRLTKMDAANKFATTFVSTCTIPVSRLLVTEMYFYDMWLLLDGKTLYPVPILVQNYKVNKETVNAKSDRSKWQLNRRFFLVENLVGKTTQAGKLTMIRYAKEIHMFINLRTSDGQIYPPYLSIKYDSVDVSDDAEVAKSSKDVSFKVTYLMDEAQIKEDTHIAIGCLSGVAAILAFIKVFSWRRRYGIENIDCATLMKWLLYSFGTFSTMYFWIITGLSLQWLIFFKQQDVVYRLLPIESQGSAFRVLLFVSFVFKVIDIIHLIVVQVSIDIFFIDWERPRGTITQQSQAGSNTSEAPISIWRTFFVANEWNEIQTVRKISPEIQIFLTLFFLKVVGFEHLTTTDPVSRFKVDPTVDYIGEYDHILRFAVLVLVFLCIECAQWFYFGFIYERFVGDSLGDFVDLCSMGNVSIFIMENTLFGYYIHGRSVHGRADTNMREINEQMKREEEDLCGQRGLEPNSEHQTFEVGLPHKFRQQYNQVVEPLRQRDQQAQRRNIPASSGGSGGQGSLPVAIERSIQSYIAMNRFLSGFIDHSLRDMDYLVYDKLLFERIFNIEVREQPLDKAIFYKDDGKSFNSVLFYGHEWTLMLFDLLVFAVVDFIATDYILAGIITYIISKILAAVRDSMGRRNLARKTMVDQRFLI